jgi:signal peptidase II
MFRFLAIIAAVVLADQLTKYWVFTTFALHESREVIPGLFNLTYLTNNGAAFSILAGQPAIWRQVFFTGAACVALVAIFLAQRSYGRQHSLYSLGLALIAGGAIGNLIDRLRLGFVIDFLDVYAGTSHFPAFNVADSAITVGVTLFIVVNIILERRMKRAQHHREHRV